MARKPRSWPQSSNIVWYGSYVLHDGTHFEHKGWPRGIVVKRNNMAAILPEVVEPVLLFCDTFSHPENEVK